MVVWLCEYLHRNQNGNTSIRVTRIIMGIVAPSPIVSRLHSHKWRVDGDVRDSAKPLDESEELQARESESWRRVIFLSVVKLLVVSFGLCFGHTFQKLAVP